jgi:hypothetical protein
MPSPRAKIAVINFSTSGDQIIVALGAFPINVVGLAFTVGGATNMTFKNGATAQSGAIILTTAGSSMTLPIVEGGSWFYADPGNNFIMNSSGAVQVSGTLWYTNG